MNATVQESHVQPVQRFTQNILPGGFKAAHLLSSMEKDAYAVLQSLGFTTQHVMTANAVSAECGRSNLLENVGINISSPS